MSQDDYLRRQTEEQVRQQPSTEKVTEYQVPNHHNRTVINNEIDRVREDLNRKQT